MIDTMYQQMGQQFQGFGKQMGIKPEEQITFDKYMKDVFSLMSEEMSWEKMEGPMIDIEHTRGQSNFTLTPSMGNKDEMASRNNCIFTNMYKCARQ